MQKFYSYDDENDEMPDELYGIDDDGYGPDDRILLDDPETMDNGYEAKNLVSMLRSELKIPYEKRGVLSFRYNGVDYDGVPMLEINPDKFVFEIGDDGKLKTFVLSDMVITM